MSLRSVLGEMRGACDLGLYLANHLPSALPSALAGRVRPRLLRVLAGVPVGDETFLPARLEMIATRDARRNLRFGSRCFVNASVYFDANAPITIGDDVFVGHHTKIITSGHEIGPPNRRAGTVTARPITLGNGVWIAARMSSP